ncbi:MAG TPA: cupredoxin domain-containing protein [Dehalococcoidia bacterium]|nr:cupredoxin domain-containing protein [Dehalococcoidia bacterium]
MEYIQTILFQIPASQIDQASQPGGLLADLDAHREYLKGLPGFQDIRITRSINNEGNVLVVVDTRWSDDASLVRYETSEPNAALIVRGHESILVRDSLQVLDMEALRTESSFRHAEASAHARDRVILPVAIPLGVLAFALLVIYGLSRVYLEIQGDGAVALAAALTIFVLLVAAYFAFNPRAAGWQFGALVAVLAIALAGGTTWALVEEDDHGEENGHANGEPPPGNGEPPAGDTIVLGDNYFEFDGERDPDIPLTAGEEVTFVVENAGAASHNMHVNGTDNEYEESLCETGGPSTACSDPEQITAGQTGEITIMIDEAGTYNFRCDFHPVEMIGTLTVE